MRRCECVRVSWLLGLRVAAKAARPLTHSLTLTVTSGLFALPVDRVVSDALRSESARAEQRVRGLP